MSEVGHVVVIGGGAAGCATAFYLSAAGVKVTIVEREGIGQQASGWSAGGVNPLHGIPDPLWAFAMASYRLHLPLWPELQRLTGRDFEARRVQMAMLAPTEADVAELLALGEGFSAAEGFSARWIDMAELRAIEPRVTADGAGALLTEGNGVVDSHQFTAALAEAAERQGATVRAGAVGGVEQAGGRVSGVRLGDDVIACDAVVVAMGPWTGAAGAWLDCSLPVEPLKGEMLRLDPLGPPLGCDVVAPVASLYGRADGQVWIGSTQERNGFDKQISEAAYRTLHDGAVSLMPALANARLIQQTVCLRPATPDDLPIVGQVPGRKGAYVATGGGTKGILLAPAMGWAIADMIMTGSTDLPVETLDPARF
jgi:glycine oxidase